MTGCDCNRYPLKKKLEIIFPSWSGKPKQTWNILKPCNHLPARHFLLGFTTPFLVVKLNPQRRIHPRYPVTGGWLYSPWLVGEWPSGWWYTYPSEKYESVGIMKFPIIIWKTKVPKHQPENDHKLGESIPIDQSTPDFKAHSPLRGFGRWRWTFGRCVDLPPLENPQENPMFCSKLMWIIFLNSLENPWKMPCFYSRKW